MTDLAVAVAVTDSAGLKTSASSTITVTTAATTIDVGQTSVGPTSDGGNSNLILAQPITLSAQATLQSLSFYVRTVGGNLRLGLYSGASVPTTLVAQTASFTPSVVGWTKQVPLTMPVCPAGKYWLTYLPSSDALGFNVLNSGGPSYYKAFAFGPMPATFPTGTTAIGALWSFYGTFSTAPPPPLPHTPIGIGVSSVSVGKPPNANSVVGAINVTMADSTAYTGQLTLGGTDAAKFALTHGGVLPCNLVVGPTDIPAGNYSINLTAS